MPDMPPSDPQDLAPTSDLISGQPLQETHDKKVHTVPIDIVPLDADLLQGGFTPGHLVVILPHRPRMSKTIMGWQRHRSDCKCPACMN